MNRSKYSTVLLFYSVLLYVSSQPTYIAGSDNAPRPMTEYHVVHFYRRAGQALF